MSISGPSSSLDDLVADVAKIASLSADERSRVQLQCAAILAALATAPPPVEDQDLTPAEAAKRMQVGRSTVYEMMRDGKLRYIQKGRRGKLIPASEIEEFRKRNLRRGDDQAYDAVRARVRNA